MLTRLRPCVDVETLLCPLCGGGGTHYGEKDGATLRWCHSGHAAVLISFPWETAEQYERQYLDTEYHRGACERLGLPWQESRFDEHRLACHSRLTWILEHCAPESLLDVGASNAAMVYSAKEFELPASGVEPSSHMCQWVRENLGIVLANVGWRELWGSWGIITACDVIEHLLDPVAFLRKCLEHTRLLYLETPDWSSAHGPEWKHVKPKEHPILYSRDALIELVNHAGWRVKEEDVPIIGKRVVLLTPR